MHARCTLIGTDDFTRYTVIEQCLNFSTLEITGDSIDLYKHGFEPNKFGKGEGSAAPAGGSHSYWVANSCSLVCASIVQFWLKLERHPLDSSYRSHVSPTGGVGAYASALVPPPEIPLGKWRQ